MKKRQSDGEDLWQWARKTAEQAQPAPTLTQEREAAGITRHLRGLLLNLGRKFRRPPAPRG